VPKPMYTALADAAVNLCLQHCSTVRMLCRLGASMAAARDVGGLWRAQGMWLRTMVQAHIIMVARRGGLAHPQANILRVSIAVQHHNDQQERALAHMIMVALVAAATSGSTPISSISGPFTMPPPTPNMPVWGAGTGVAPQDHIASHIRARMYVKTSVHFTVAVMYKYRVAPATRPAMLHTAG
jgi:hypothetical protein